jgi:hypothetical protein
MKYIITLLLIQLSLVLNAQYRPSDHSTYLTASVGSLGENYVRLEHDVTDSWAILQGSIQAGPNGFGLQYKLGAGYVSLDRKIRVYGYLPYFNYSFTGKGYNTPFGIEVFLWNNRIQASTNLDIYTQGIAIIPSVRIRYQLTKFKL